MSIRNRYPVGAIPLVNTTAPTVGAGEGHDLGSGFSVFALQGGVSTGGSTKATIQLQGSLDGTHWVNLGGTFSATTAWLLAKSTSAIPVTQVRANVVSFSTLVGATPDVPVDLRVNLAVG